MAALPNNKVVSEFHLPPQTGCVVQAFVGQGSYGAVCTAIRTTKDEKSGKEVQKLVAIKKIPFVNKTSDNARITLRELQILNHFQPVDQIIKCHDAFINSPPGNPDRVDVYIVMDYVESTLGVIIKTGGLAVVNNERTLQFVICQLLLALAPMHAQNCTHRDLSCNNVLIDKEANVSLCDFGLARFYDPEEKMSYGRVTQQYRAPEILCDARYTGKVDVWSVGVLMAELLTKTRLFPGKPNDVVDQLRLILLRVGIPEESWFSTTGAALASSSYNAERYIRSWIREASKRVPKPPVADSGDIVVASLKAQFLFEVSPEGQDLLNQLLRFNPDNRLSAAEALAHRWFQQPAWANFVKDSLKDQESIPKFGKQADQSAKKWAEKDNEEQEGKEEGETKPDESAEAGARDESITKVDKQGDQSAKKEEEYPEIGEEEEELTPRARAHQRECRLIAHWCNQINAVVDQIHDRAQASTVPPQAQDGGSPSPPSVG